MLLDRIYARVLNPDYLVSFHEFAFWVIVLQDRAGDGDRDIDPGSIDIVVESRCLGLASVGDVGPMLDDIPTGLSPPDAV